MTTPEQIREAYSSTLMCAYGHKIEDCLSTVGEIKSRAVYSLLTYLRYEKSLFNAKIFSNGEIKIFYVTYKMGEFEIIVKRFDWICDYPFSTVETFAEWLNDCEKRIIEAAKSLT